jgi:hypothetical protein
MFKKLLGLILLSITTFVFAADETDTKGDDKEKAERGFVVAGDDKKEGDDKEKAERGFVVAAADDKEGEKEKK